MNLLAVAPHPDDIEYSCFGTLCKMKEDGARVVCYLATCGGPNDLTGGRGRTNESKMALNLIPADEVIESVRHGLSQSDYANICYGLDLAISDHHIDMILSPYPEDSNQDHRMIADVVLSSVRRKKVSVIYYNALSSLDFLPNLWVDITKYFNKKMAALSFLGSQMSKDWMDLDYIKMFNQDMQSKLLGYEYSERYIIKRCFL
jgi:LmbE family N-acetylglucosaminyl deacetylase